jgi:hypothetical protein
LKQRTKPVMSFICDPLSDVSSLDSVLFSSIVTGDEDSDKNDEGKCRGLISVTIPWLSRTTKTCRSQELHLNL